MSAALPELPDLWAPVSPDHLPPALVASVEEADWAEVRRQLGPLMDGAITDGVFGRELLQLMLRLPSDVEPVFDRFRATAFLDHGDWDSLRAALPSLSIAPAELARKRDILIAPLDYSLLPPGDTDHERWALEITEHQARSTPGGLRHWAHRINGQYPTALWERDDVAIGRHLRYRQLHDVAMLSIGESHGGRLHVAHALASEASRVGDEREPLRAVATDIAELVRRGMGDRNEFALVTLPRIAEPRGPSPLGSAEMLLYVLPLLPLKSDESLGWAAALLARIASRFASPRWQLQADSWIVADALRNGESERKTELAGLITRSRRASPGLRALPVFLQGVARRSVADFQDAEVLARRAGAVWLQVSSLTWMVALDPQRQAARRLRRLIDATGWRRPALVPTEIAGDAALGLNAQAERSEAVLEMALAADRPNVTTEIVRSFVEDTRTPIAARLAAVDTLARVGTTHAREILSRLAQRRDDIGKAAAKTAERPAYGLSEREIEVLSLAADGLTNKQIGEKLFLSHHTVARHLANARGKLGAANRAEAAVRLHRTGSD